MDQKRNFLLQFARKNQHHHSIIPIISDKHTHTQDLCAVTLITQGLGKHVDYRHCDICISHLYRHCDICISHLSTSCRYCCGPSILDVSLQLRASRVYFCQALHTNLPHKFSGSAGSSCQMQQKGRRNRTPCPDS